MNIHLEKNAISPSPFLKEKFLSAPRQNYPLLSFHLLILRCKSPSLCCIGFNLLSLAIARTLSPCLSTRLSIHSSSRLLCCLGFRFFNASSSRLACSSRAWTTPGVGVGPEAARAETSGAASGSSSSSRGSLRGLALRRRRPAIISVASSSAWMTRRILPVSGSRSTRASVGTSWVAGLVLVEMLRGSLNVLKAEESEDSGCAL